MPLAPSGLRINHQEKLQPGPPPRIETVSAGDASACVAEQSRCELQRQEMAMSVPVNTQRLIREMARRGWNGRDLARAAGISGPTVTMALAGRPIAPATLKRIALALLAAPPVEGIDSLLLGD
jgi:DNA-binding Xre family transcriptional regulator